MAIQRQRGDILKNRAIDLFAGAGGLSLGLKMGGWDVTTAVEYDATAVETHRLNMPEVLHICDDIREVDFKAYAGKIELVAGGPPCQPFSVSGKRLGKNDVRDMVPEFVRVVRECRPVAFVMENVQGLASARFLPYLQARIAELSSLGYEVQWSVLNAADYGVAQNRRRLFVVGVPPGVKFHFPTPTHGMGRRKKHVTVTEALSGCPSDEPNRAKVVFCKNPILRQSPYAGMLLNGKGRPLNMAGPSHTIPATAGGNRTHILDTKGVIAAYHARLLAGAAPVVGQPADCRRLTVRESARLQAFPDWFRFSGRRSQQYAQVGNAVPPELARVVSAALKDALFTDEVVPVKKRSKSRVTLR